MTALANTNTSHGHLPGTVGTGETFWNLYYNRQTQHNETSIVHSGSWNLKQLVLSESEREENAAAA